MIRLFLISFFLLSEYSYGNDNLVPIDIYEEYKKTFEDEYNVSTKEYIVEYLTNESEKNISGLCDFKEKKVFINKHNRQDYEFLFFHEMGHCVLKLAHDFNYNEAPDGSGKLIPKSLMFPSNANICFRKYKDYYIKELRDRLISKSSFDIMLFENIERLGRIEEEKRFYLQLDIKSDLNFKDKKFDDCIFGIFNEENQ